MGIAINCRFWRAIWSTTRIIYRWIRHCAGSPLLSLSLFLSLRFYSYFLSLAAVLGLPCYLSSVGSKSCGTRLSLWVRGCEIFTLSPGHQLDRALPDVSFRFTGRIGSRVNVGKQRDDVTRISDLCWLVRELTFVISIDRPLRFKWVNRDDGLIKTNIIFN